jgi:hypothetical protein
MTLKVSVPARFSYLAPVRTELSRLGRSRDGGYVVARRSVEESQALISLGLSNEWSFDSEFLATCKHIDYRAVDRSSGFLVYVFAFIRSITRAPFRPRAAGKLLIIALRFLLLVPPVQLKRRRRFFRKWVRVSVNDVKRDVTIHHILESIGRQSRVFLKIDVEGGEYELLPAVLAIAEQEPDRFSGLCVEFHDMTSREEEFHDILRRMQQTFSIVHLHANNAVPLANDFVNVLEISFARKVGNENTQVRRLPIPGLDFPNHPEFPDLTLVFP